MNVVPFEIGDVHLGRKFTNGVPLHRKGHREALVMQDFKDRVTDFAGKLLVQPGDLFDSFTVDEAIVLEASRIVREAATKNPDTTYVFVRGNHDASKDANKASSFDVFSELMRGLINVFVLDTPTALYFDKQVFGFIPWHPFKSADTLAQELIANYPGVEFEMVYGHWDVEGYGSAAHDFNMIPTKTLCAVTKDVRTGHVHKPCGFIRDGVAVTVIGSMQPYAHGEEAGSVWYKTLNFTDYSASRETRAADYLDMNLRVLVKEGEIPEPVDCLSFITKKVTDKDDGDEADLDVQISDFNMDALFAQSLQERGVSTKVSELVSARFKELRNTGA